MTNNLEKKKMALESIKEEIEKETKIDSENLSEEYIEGFNEIYKKYMVQLEKEVEKIALFEVEDCWEYVVDTRDTGVSLSLQHISDVIYSPDNEIVDMEIAEIYTLAEIKAPLLTIEEYAERYKIEPQKVKEYIQDCRIRSALKLGREWRIPELAQIQNGEYNHRSEYEWNCTLTDLAEGYEFVNECDRITIEKEGDGFQVVFWKNFRSYKVMHCDDWERKKIEMYFIANPLVNVDVDNNIIYSIGVA